MPVEQLAQRRRICAVAIDRAVAGPQLNAAEADGGDVLNRLRHVVAPRDPGVAELHGSCGVHGPAREGPAKAGRHVRESGGGKEFAACHHECTVPSSLRFTGRYAGSYGCEAASPSSMSTPRPGASPGCIAPLSNV